MATNSPPLEIPGAQRIVLSHISAPLPAESVEITNALGLRLAADVLALRPHPPFPAAIKDGFAVASSDGAGERTVVSASRAGASASVQKALSARQAAYVTTGAPMPPGTDSVIQIESVAAVPDGTPATPESARINVSNAPIAGSEVRAIGSDIPQGQRVLSAFDVLGAAEVGLLATIGHSTASVVRRPRLGVLSTGDELLDPLGTAPASATDVSGRIFDCNRPLLLAAARAAGCDTTDFGIAKDQQGSLERALDTALAADVDVLVCSGGVSMGDRDLVKPLLSRRGTVHFGKVRMKPGKPLTFATVPRAGGANAPVDVGDTRVGGGHTSSPAASSRSPLLVFGLPGNPVSAFACFQLVVAPALRKLSGDPSPLPRRVAVTLASPMKMDPERPEFHRAIVAVGPDGALVARSTGGQISSRLLSCRAADALVELPMASGTLPVGTKVSALLIGPLHRGAGAGIDDLEMALPPQLPPSHDHGGGPGGGGFNGGAGGGGGGAGGAGSWYDAWRKAGSSGGFAFASPHGPCRIGVVVHQPIGTGGGGGGGARTAQLLDALGSRLLPGSWIAEVREVGDADHPKAAESALAGAARELTHEAGCSVVIVMASPGGGGDGGGGGGGDVSGADAVRAALSTLQPSREVPALGSLMRSACLAPAPASALLGPWSASVYAEALVLLVPGEAQAAIACVAAVLPCATHAVAQAGSRPPPRVRA